MTAIEPVRESRTKAAEDTLLIDTDVHENWSAMTDLEPVMDPFWREQMDRYFSKPVLGSHYLAPVQHRGTRKEWHTGGYMGTSLGAMQQHLFDEEGEGVRLPV